MPDFASELQPSVPRRVVLIADDSPEDRETVRRHLQKDERFAYEVREVETAAGLLNALPDADIACLVLDYQLPDARGLDVLEQIKNTLGEDIENPALNAVGEIAAGARARLISCPVVMLTGKDEVELAVAALQAGAHEYLVKDRLTRDDIQRAVDSAIEKAELREGVARRTLELERELGERARVERLLAAQKHILERIARSEKLPELLCGVVSEIENLIPGALCSVLLRDEENEQLLCTSAPSFHPDYSAAINGLEIGPRKGSCGTAAWRKEIVVVSDIWADPLWEEFRELAKKHQLRACWSTPILDSHGELLGTFATYFREVRVPQPHELDVTGTAAYLVGIAIERTHAATRLRESEERLRLASEGAALAVWEWDLGSDRVRSNSRLNEIFGLPDDEITLAAQVLERIHPEDRAHVEAEIERAIATRGAFRAEFRVVNDDGSLRAWLRAVAQTRAEEDSSRVSLVGINEDITIAKQLERAREELLEREKRARAEAEALNRAKDEFLATLSHELRTPLTAVIGWTDILQSEMERSGELDTEMVERAIDIIARNAQSQRNLIEDILDVSRIITGKLKITPEPLDLVEVCRQSFDALANIAHQKDLDYRAELPDAPCSMQGDANRLLQVLSNLLANAIKFTPKGGRVTLALRWEAERAVIAVEDSGIGIAPEFLPYVFDRFQQADSSSTRKYTGLGLGLAIVRYLVEQHDGHVAAHSDGEGHGATFQIELPLQTASAVAVSNPTQSDARPLEGWRVLSVDDETDVRELVQFVLRRAGAHVEVASNVQEALEHIASQSFDAVVSDIAMPVEDGYTFIRTLHQRFDGQLPFVAVALSAYASESNRRRALDEGFDAHLSKPVKSDTLIATLRDKLGEVENGKAKNGKAALNGKNGRHSRAFQAETGSIA